jgi:hypothetical protein
VGALSHPRFSARCACSLPGFGHRRLENAAFDILRSVEYTEARSSSLVHTQSGAQPIEVVAFGIHIRIYLDKSILVWRRTMRLDLGAELGRSAHRAGGERGPDSRSPTSVRSMITGRNMSRVRPALAGIWVCLGWRFTFRALVRPHE